MDWVPFVFGTIKVVALGTGMFFAIKWHYDQGKKIGMRAVLRASAKMVAIFVLAVVILGAVTFGLGSMLGLDLSY
ncbi:hypothetical protein AUP42_06520 [Thalassospira lucentensis]|uniref:Uncharacterized protein n=1 Tax=Thalassospira lucentensis TaxID=168935 RepID=A0A154L120_9PROT|nr:MULTISPECIES: hypothetical protein [Thalassospira]KZB61604.1 hypothetical protein AUP42_06520 [Thalassospira lucentensis]MAZ32646.1 hypothetical protein [Thalassospira sp.]MBO9507259.1 hypothetical protein [Thalassospira sp. A3_1]WOI12858.1 hypothetical protein R1T41_09745 [Thalassospira lucentensis]|tara:strand:- start:412 stop:636 length:225 start_codon:yes stop_codon:yes gene_type:complete